MALKSISQPRVRLADKVYDQIIGAIHDGSISPDDRLVQEKLAEELGISRTPIREALFRMEQEGILRVAQRGGFMIRMPESGEISELYEARAAIESFAARQLAEENNPEKLRCLRELISKEEKLRNDSVPAYFNANRTIHRAFVKATDNRFMLEFFDKSWSKGTSFAVFATIKTQSLSTSLGGHMELVDIIETGDPTAAAEAMIKHIFDGLQLQQAE